MKREILLLIIVTIFTIAIAACGIQNNTSKSYMENLEKSENKEVIKNFNSSDSITKVEDGLYVVEFSGDYGFETFLNRGGASNDNEVANYIMQYIYDKPINISFNSQVFGCSTIYAKSDETGYIFGRNFDWNKCDSLIIKLKSNEGYSSVATVNMDFIDYKNINNLTISDKELDRIKTLTAIYAPLDGMNEKGLMVAVNMISDNDKISQSTNKPNITTTTAVRLLLDKAENTNEAIELLQQYDFHASNGMMVHFAIADIYGNSVVVEYINNEMQVIDTPVVTNFYLTSGSKYGIGTTQSHIRYNMLMDILQNKQSMTQGDIKNALDNVSKHNFGTSESTEWSVVMLPEKKQLLYFHRENYDIGYIIFIDGSQE